MPVDDAPHAPDAVGFILRLARALHNYGYAAHRLEEVSARTAARLSGAFVPFLVIAFGVALGSKLAGAVLGAPTPLLDREVVLGVATMFKMILMAVALAAGLVAASVVAPHRRTL